jgi:hypothetical protein
MSGMAGAHHKNGIYPTQKMILETKSEGGRGVGGPKLRWLNDIEADMDTLHIKGWRLGAQDRKEWTNSKGR